jgi:Entner-Doudoroff aldolase
MIHKMTPNIEQTANRIKLGRIIAIMRGDFTLDKLLEIGDALLAAPVLAMEVTLNSRNALEAISILRKRANNNMLVGAGTVRTPEQVEAALDAGAQFLISPGFVPNVVALAQEKAILHIPGIFTPTEAEAAAAAGCRMLKLFPSDLVGPAYLKALRAPLDDIDFVPTGGINVNNIGQYARAGAAAVGVGSSLISGPKTSMAEIISAARAMQSAWESVIT